MTTTIGHFIDGSIIPGNGKNVGNIYNPATGKIANRVVLADAADVNTAVAAAKAALPAWSSTPPLKRARVLFKFKELIEQNMEQLAAIVTAEHGKTISDAKGSIQRGLEVVEYVCGIPHLLKGSYSENVGSGIDSYSMRQPLGVCAGIAPFNFPAMIPLWMFPMAVACGNTFVLKPSEKDPSCAMELARLFMLAGAPAGVLNIVNGAKEAVDTLLTHPDVAGIAFVGSTPIAEYVYQTAIKHHKRVQAFGGAKNHCIVMPDADLDQVADAVVGAAYGSAGQRCMAISVAVVVGDTMADALVAKMKPHVETLKIGAGTSVDIEMGPLISQEALDKVIKYIGIGVNEGATLVVDGREQTHPKEGFFVGGCLFDHVKPNMEIYKNEIFGPLLCVVRVPDYETALKLINENEYGNGTAIFTRDGDTARDFAARVQVGMIGINVPIPVPVAYHSFGGWKRSIFADIHMHGMEGVNFYTRLKTVTTRWPTGIRIGKEFAMPLVE